MFKKLLNLKTILGISYIFALSTTHCLNMTKMPVAISAVKAHPYATIAACAAAAAGKYVHYRYNFHNNRAARLTAEAARATHAQIQIDALKREMNTFLSGQASPAAKLARAQELGKQIGVLEKLQKELVDKPAQALVARAAAQRASNVRLRGIPLSRGQDLIFMCTLMGVGIATYATMFTFFNLPLEIFRQHQLFGTNYIVPKSLNFEWFPQEFVALKNYQNALVYNKNCQSYFRNPLNFINGTCALLGTGTLVKAWLDARDAAAAQP